MATVYVQFGCKKSGEKRRIRSCGASRQEPRGQVLTGKADFKLHFKPWDEYVSLLNSFIWKHLNNKGFRLTDVWS